ncbi:MAG: YdeI/OmpD-associated family protein [Syntrophomonadaceae bacterium]|nr:YdeI/OmpD-associated family protein [Syntrophomonadaceae bacterium]
MPEFVWQALVEANLVDKYRRRPPYQQNDYIGWIVRGNREETRQKRLQQMLCELAAGEKYMSMEYHAR